MEVRVRLVLAMIVAALNAAGPGLCCCVVAWGTAPAAAAKSELAPNKHSCPFCVHENPAESAPKDPATPKPCECQQRLLEAPAALPDAPVEVAFDLCIDSFTDRPVNGTFTTLIVTGPQSDIPFLPPKDRLKVHHVLRC
jgi:hypothetical protein